MHTWDVPKLYHLQVEHPLQSRLELLIPCLAIMVYVVYRLFSSYGIPISIREILQILGGGRGRYLDIAQ